MNYKAQLTLYEYDTMREDFYGRDTALLHYKMKLTVATQYHFRLMIQIL